MASYVKYPQYHYPLSQHPIYIPQGAHHNIFILGILVGILSIFPLEYMVHEAGNWPVSFVIISLAPELMLNKHRMDK